MQKCKELSRLKKVTGLSSISFRNQTPGSSLGAHITLQRKILDPSHPAANIRRNLLPSARGNVLSVTALPFSLLEEQPVPRQPPFNYEIETWKDRIARTLRDSDVDMGKVSLLPVNLPKYHRPGRIPMSLVQVVTKKQTSKKKFVRLRIINKIKTALYLVAVRGAEAKEGKLVMDENKVDEGLILRGWTYVFFPQIDIYLMPYSEIIQEVRKLLNIIHKKATGMESQWVQESLKNTNIRQTKVADRKKSLPQDKLPSRRNDFEANIEADSLWKDIAKPTQIDDEPLGNVSDAEFGIPETKDKYLSEVSEKLETATSTHALDSSLSPQTLEVERQAPTAASSDLGIRPKINFGNLFTPPSTQVPPTPPPKRIQKWNFNAARDTPSTSSAAAEVENQWVKLYSSPLEMAKRKIFHAKPVFGKIPEVSSKNFAREIRAKDLERKRKRVQELALEKVAARDQRKGKSSRLEDKLYKLWDEDEPVDEKGTGFGVKKVKKT